MASSVKIFDTTPVIATQSDWELQLGGNASITRSRAQSLKSNGDQLNAVQFGAKVSYSETFTAKTVATTQQKTALDVPKAGAISGGAHIDSIAVTYNQTTAPQLVVSSHKHSTVAGVVSTHDTTRTYTPTVVFPIRAIGVPTTLKDTSNATIFTVPVGCGINSINYSLSVTHVDVDNNEGDHLAGQNRDGVETLTLNFTGAIDTADISIDSSWMLPDSDANSESNTAATTKSITITKHVAMDVVSAGD